MEQIQWSLVAFTALTGMGGWMFVCVAIDEFLQKAKKHSFKTALVALILVAIGGCASITHLSHPTRVLNALQHPTSGIFIEIVLVGCLGVCILIYLLMVRRKVSPGACKVVAVIGALFGVVLSFMVGESYMMESRPNWDTQLLPLGYLGTAIPSGVAAYLVSVLAFKVRDAKKEAEDADTSAPLNLNVYVTLLIAGGVIALVTAVAYVLVAGVTDTAVAVLFALCLIGSGVVPIVCGVLMRKSTASSFAMAVTSVVCTLIGSVSYRCIMWAITVPIANLFGISL